MEKENGLKISATAAKRKFLATDRWKRRILSEKKCTESMADSIVSRVIALTDYMQYGHAIIAFYKQNGSFQLVTGTLISYQQEFHQAYDVEQVRYTFIFWCLEEKGWRSFQLENFLAWKPIV